MARPLVLGNPRLHIGIDSSGDFVDVYYPYVGYPNHAHRISAGVYDVGLGRVSWLREGWRVSSRYDGDAPIGVVEALSDDFRLKLTRTDFVHYSKEVMWSRINVQNISDTRRSVRLFVYNDLHIKEHPYRDTAMLDRHLKSIVHYKDDFYFAFGSFPTFDEFAVGKKELQGLEGTWRDAEDGKLSGNMVSHGNVDSCVGWSLDDILPSAGRKVDYYLVAARSFKEMQSKISTVIMDGYENAIAETAAYWKAWVSRSGNNPEVDQKVWNLLRRSLVLMRLLTSENGAIVASSDSEITRFGGDNYNYVWPRDASWCAEALDVWSYHDVTDRIFDFLCSLMTGKGYLLHKYYPTGNFGSTWHPVPFIQIDQTGSMLHAFWNHYALSRNIEQVSKRWSDIVSAGKFLVEWRDKETGLPKPSWDVWEEKKAENAYSASAVYGGLVAASKFAEVMGREDFKEYVLEASEKVRQGILTHLYDKRLERFIKSTNPRDDSVDASLFGLFYFGVLPTNDERVVRTMKEVESQLWVGKGAGGIARYIGDQYFRVSTEVIGNPWILTTLYLAIYHAEIGNFQKAKSLIEWAANSTVESGLMSEQIDPFSGKPVSVLPLAWSHAAFALAVKRLLDKLRGTGKSWKDA